MIKKKLLPVYVVAQLLISAKIVKGRDISGYYSMMDDLINAGANYIDEKSVVDDNIITTAHYKDMGPWMKSALEVFIKKTANERKNKFFQKSCFKTLG